MLTVGSLFSGIGGLDLGLERAGMKVIWQSEIDNYASKVLKKHWPEVPNLGDITKIDWGTVKRPDLLCGGFPCQPVSLAGRRRGNQDSRWLWPFFREAIRCLRPSLILIENVIGLRSKGGPGILRDLAALGYDAEWETISAESIGAPHIRERVFIVAYIDSDRYESWAPLQLRQETGKAHKRHSREPVRIHGSDKQLFGRAGPSKQEWPKPPVLRVALGISGRLDRIRCLGNAVVPQVAEYIGRQIIAALPSG